MDLRQLRYVLAVAEHRKIRAAAKVLHIAQQSLSEQIAAVERELGVPLFTRSRAGMAPTPACEVFLAHATIALDAADQVLRATRAAAGMADPVPVRLAVATGLAPLAGEVLRRYLARRPQADVRLADLHTASQLDALRNSQITAGIAYRPSQPRELRGLAAYRLYASAIQALLRRGDPLARTCPVSLNQLASRPLLLPPETDAAGLRHQLLGLFAANNVIPTVGTNVYGHEMAMASVAAGRGYALCVPPLARIDDDLVLLPLAETGSPLEMSLIIRRADRDPAVVELITVARDIARSRWPFQHPPATRGA